MSEHKYKMKYKFDPEYGEFSSEEIKESGMGGTDAMIMMSCIYPEDGSLSTQFWSFDGRNKGEELSTRELFKMWMMLGRNLSQRGDLDEFRQTLAKFPAETFFKTVIEPQRKKE